MASLATHRAVGLCLALAIASVAAAADDAAEFNKAKYKIQQKLRHKQVLFRLEGVREAGQFVTLDAAKLLVKLALADQADEVRKAAYDVLLLNRVEPEIAEFLHQEFIRACKAGITRQSLPLVALAALTTDEASRAEVIKVLNDTLGTPKADALLMAALIDGLAEEGAKSSLVIFDALMQTSHFRSHFGFHRTLIQALTRLRHREALDALIGQLPSLRGETLGDALKHLSAVSGKSFGPNPPEWLAWWQQNRETFEFPPLNATAKATGIGDDRQQHGSQYYRLPIEAKRIVFIIDISKSMVGEKMTAAQQSLIKCVQSLPEDAQFNIVAFHSEVFTCDKALAPATAENKRQANSFVSGLQPNHRTATYDALHTATSLAPEAIYLVTDGAPTTGKIIAPQEIVSAISRTNRATRISIYTVGIQVEDGGTFLQELAAHNWGQFRAVE